MLSKRHREVLQSIWDYDGDTVTAAQQLHIAESTYKDHLRAIYGELHARNKTEALIKALKTGLISSVITYQAAVMENGEITFTLPDIVKPIHEKNKELTEKNEILQNLLNKINALSAESAESALPLGCQCPDCTGDH